MSKGKKFGVGIAIGAAIGVVAGLLTAPKSGKETRQDVKNKAKELKGVAERKLKEAHKELGSLAEQAKKYASTVSGKAKDEWIEIAKKAEALKDQVKAAITSIKSGDDEDDEATVDQLLSDLDSLRAKVTRKVRELKK